jgi:hypothetical protein
VRFREEEVERFFWIKDETGDQKGRCFLVRVIRESAWEVMKPKSAYAPDSDVNQRSKIKGDGFSGGMKPLKHRYQALIEFDEKVQERRGEGKPSFDHLRGARLCRGKPMSVRS